MQNLFNNVYLFILVICFFCSLIVYIKGTAHEFLKLFPLFTLLTLIIEVFGAIIKRVEYNEVYNYFVVIEFNFYFFVLSRISKSSQVRKMLLIAMLAYSLFALVNLIFIQGVKYLASYSINLGAFLVVIFSGICLNELFKTKDTNRIFRNPAFWICFGLIIYYASSFPIWAGIYIMIEMPAEDRKGIIIAHFLTNYILYLSFIMSFLCEFLFWERLKSKA